MSGWQFWFQFSKIRPNTGEQVGWPLISPRGARLAACGSKIQRTIGRRARCTFHAAAQIRAHVGSDIVRRAGRYVACLDGASAGCRSALVSCVRAIDTVKGSLFGGALRTVILRALVVANTYWRSPCVSSATGSRSGSARSCTAADAPRPSGRWYLPQVSDASNIVVRGVVKEYDDLLCGQAVVGGIPPRQHCWVVCGTGH